MGTLYVLATPIGNLRDISLRALDILKEADVVFTEDTRVTRKLLSRYGVRTPAKRYNEHSPERVFQETKKRLLSGENIVLVSDAGTPGISDPGAKLVAFVRDKVPKARIEVVPGPSAVTAALSISGIPANRFTFVGYPPAKRKRKAFFEELKGMGVKPLVLYESPHRFQRTLDELAHVFGEGTEIFIARELTKIYEEHFTGTVAEAREHFSGERGKGEFVLLMP